jgi:hypothetical protein
MGGIVFLNSATVQCNGKGQRDFYIPSGFYSLVMLQGQEATEVCQLGVNLWDSMNLMHQLALWASWIAVLLRDVNLVHFHLSPSLHLSLRGIVFLDSATVHCDGKG